MIFGIIGLFIPLIPSLVGIILGIIGLNRTKDPRIGGKGLAIAGISVSVASIFLGGCMISILLPSLNRARETANRVKCASNLRQIGQALLLYGNDNRGVYPPDFPPLLLTQDITAEVFVCPSTNTNRADQNATVQQQAAVLHQHCNYIYLPGHNYNASARHGDRVRAADEPRRRRLEFPVGRRPRLLGEQADGGGDDQEPGGGAEPAGEEVT